MIKPEDVTIIIPHWGSTPEQKYALNECLTSLEETAPEIKRIVAFNGAKTLPTVLTEQIKGTDFIVVSEQGQCKAVNAAVATTNTPWIMVTNDDMVYPPGWFEMLAEAPENMHPCRSPKLVEPRPGAPTFLVEFCGGAGGDFNKQKFLDFVYRNKWEGDTMIETGFNLPFLIKRDLWDLVGGYDINYDPFSSNSDSDLEYKIKLAGVQPVQIQTSLVYHFSQTSGTFHPDNQAYWNANWEYFIKKFGFPRTDNGIWEANFKIPTKQEGRIYFPSYEGKYGEV